MVTKTYYKSYDHSYICRHKCNQSPYAERFTKKCAIPKCLKTFKIKLKA